MARPTDAIDVVCHAPELITCVGRVGGPRTSSGTLPHCALDATHTKVDLGALYLQALKRANGVVDGGKTINGSNDEPGE